jgi:hypothetical protein
MEKYLTKNEWYAIELFNKNVNITRENTFMDEKGYLRWKYGKYKNILCHRNIAYNNLFDKKKYKKKFSEYEIHHKDFNKLNNNIKNLEILTTEEHDKKHEFFIDSKSCLRCGKEIDIQYILCYECYSKSCLRCGKEIDIQYILCYKCYSKKLI